jgi:hypothetical protein
LKDKIKLLEKTIYELNSELAVKDNLLKIKNGLCKTDESVTDFHQSEEDFSEDYTFEELAAKCEELEKKVEKLNDRYQSDCIRINQLLVAIDTLVDRYAKLKEIHGL